MDQFLLSVNQLADSVGVKTCEVVAQPLIDADSVSVYHHFCDAPLHAGYFVLALAFFVFIGLISGKREV